MVAQNFHRWPFAARVDIGIGRPGGPLDDATVGEAAVHAGAHDVVKGLPRCLDTLLARGYRAGDVMRP
ncbi:hypothetical protein ABZ572_37485 [Streptomyces sp. NPDC018338]|uniref:hypothetical protein n=1 Tax=Streptomyces sp. NPDC018338 TaxID=3157192 RepID=UPI0033C1D4D5